MRPTPRSSPLLILICILLALPALAQSPQDPFEAARAAFTATDDNAERLAIATDFLTTHPNHANAADVAGAATDLILHTSDDRPAAVALLETQLTRTTDPEVLTDLRNLLLRTYGHPDYAQQLQAMVTSEFDLAAMSFGAQLGVLESAAAAEAWTLVDQVGAATLDNASGAAFAADYPDRNDSAEDLREYGDNRQGLVLTQLGWSQVNQGDLKAGLKTFKKAEKLLRTGFVGVPGNELYRYWGQALVTKGKAKDGIKKLALAELFGGDHAAGELARDHYADLDRKQSYDDFTWELRRKHGPEMASFDATDYTGAVRSYHDLKGKQATLVAFWFPT